MTAEERAERWDAVEDPPCSKVNQIRHEVT